MTVFDFESRCFYCGRELDLPGPGSNNTADHVVPRMKLPPSGLEFNTVRACFPCNLAKGGKSLEKYRRIGGGRRFFGETRPTAARIAPYVWQRGQRLLQERNDSL